MVNREEEFDLSDLIESVDGDLEMIRVTAIQEFIRRLKKRFEYMPNTRSYAGIEILEEIDKLAGDKLK